MKTVEIISLDEALLEKGRGPDKQPRKKRESKGTWKQRFSDARYEMTMRPGMTRERLEEWEKRVKKKLKEYLYQELL